MWSNIFVFYGEGRKEGRSFFSEYECFTFIFGQVRCVFLGFIYLFIHFLFLFFRRRGFVLVNTLPCRLFKSVISYTLPLLFS